MCPSLQKKSLKNNICRMFSLGLFRVFSTTILLTFLFSCTPPRNFARVGTSFSFPGSKIVKTAQRYIGTDYKYGGNDPRGFDCSGFCNYVYKKNGYSIPRSAGEQFRAGKRVPIKRASPGDLVFFRIYGSRISHVGIYVGNYKFLHAPRRGKKVGYADMRKDYWRRRYAGTVTFFKRHPK